MFIYGTKSLQNATTTTTTTCWKKELRSAAGTTTKIGGGDAPVQQSQRLRSKNNRRQRQLCSRSVVAGNVDLVVSLSPAFLLLIIFILSFAMLFIIQSVFCFYCSYFFAAFHRFKAGRPSLRPNSERDAPRIFLQMLLEMSKTLSVVHHYHHYNNNNNEKYYHNHRSPGRSAPYSFSSLGASTITKRMSAPPPPPPLANRLEKRQTTTTTTSQSRPIDDQISRRTN